MNTLSDELKRVGLVKDLTEMEEQWIEDDTEMTPIQRRLILRRLRNQKEKVLDESERA